MSSMMPYGAREITELRRIGKRPADMVFVSLIGPLNENNPVVVIKANRDYDWRFLVALDVLVVTQTSSEGLGAVVKSIQMSAPRSLSVWFADRQDGLNQVVAGVPLKTKCGRRMGAVQRIGYAGLGVDTAHQECIETMAREAKAAAMANAAGFDAALIEFAQAGFLRLYGQAWVTA